MKNIKKGLAFVLVLTLLAGFLPLGEIAGVDWSSIFVEAQAASATGGYQEFNGHYYEVFDESMTWTEAKAYCEEMGGHLATVTSQEENDFIASLIADGTKNLYWLGGYEEAEQEGVWRWVTGETWGYDNWDVDEPNNSGDESYVEMFRIKDRYYHTPGKWNDMKNEGDSSGFYVIRNKGLVCEWENFTQIRTKELVLDYQSHEQVQDAVVTTTGSFTRIEAENYYTAEFSDTLNASGMMMYAAVPESTDSHISAVHCNGVDALLDAEYVKFPITGNSSDDDKTITISVYSDLTNVEKFQLLQNGNVIMESASGTFSLPARMIPTGASLKVRVVQNGTKYAPLDTNIKTYESKSTVSASDNKITITIPNDIQIIGGAEFSIDLSTLPVFVMRSEDTIRIGIGASEKYESLNGKVTSSDMLGSTTSDISGTTKSTLWEDWKKTVDEAKNSLKQLKFANVYEANKDIYNLKPWNMISTDSFAPTGDAKVCAYAEFKYSNGKWTSVGGNGILAVSLSFSKEWQTAVWAVPIVVKLSGSIGANADVNVGFNFDAQQWYCDADLDFTLPDLKGSVGVGIAHIFDGSVYVKLENSIKLSFNNYVSGTLSGDLGLSGKFVIFSGEKSLWNFLNWQYMYVDLTGTVARAPMMSQALPINTLSLTDESTYTLDTREYLANQSGWYGSTVARTRSISAADASAKLLQSSIYTDANPKIVSTDDGTMLMVWTADLPERATGNQTAVVYSVYNSLTGSWSEPAVVAEDGTADAFADVATDGENIYVVWMNTNKQFDETVTIQDFAAAGEICVAEYDAATSSFGAAQTITQNEVFDFMPSIYVEDGIAYVAWVQNSNNDPLTQTGTNLVSMVRIQDTVEPVAKSAVPYPVETLDVAMLGDTLYSAFSADTNGDIMTVDDVELFLLDNSGNLAQLTDNDTMEQNASFYRINGQPAFTYYAADAIQYTYDFNAWELISSDSAVAVSPYYTFVDDAEGTVLLVNRVEQNADASNVYASIWNGTNWVGNAPVTNSENDIESFSACQNTDGHLQLIYTTVDYQTEITDDNGDGSSTGTFTEVVDMYTLGYARQTDIALLDVYYTDEVVPGNDLPVTLQLYNNGLSTIDSVDVSLQFGVEYVSELPVKILPGETVEVEYNLPVPVGLTEMVELPLCVACADDADPTNNEQTIKIGYTDLSLYIEKTVSQDKTSAIVTISNQSYIPTAATVRLHKNTYDGEVVAEFPVSEIGALATEYYHLSSDTIAEHFDYGDAVCVEIIAGKQELSTGDNQQFFTVATPEVEEYSYTILDGNIIRIDKYNGTATELVIPETYDDYEVVQLAANAIPDCVQIVTLPKTMTTVNTQAFNSATTLTSILTDPENASFISQDGILYTADGTHVVRCPQAIEKKDIILPESVIEIDDYAFSETGITSVVLPEALSAIRSYAFQSTDLTEITIPEAVTIIETNSFYDCLLLEEINYNAIAADTGASWIHALFGITVFRGDTAIHTIRIGEKVQSVPSVLFARLNGSEVIVDIASDSQLKLIEDSAFYASNITDVYYGNYYKNWKTISIESRNDALLDAVLHCVECENCTWDDGSVIKTPTCVAEGQKLFTCTVCGKERVEILPIDSQNHSPEVVNQKEATCHVEGYTGDFVCVDCGTVLESGKSIPQLTHEWNNGVITTEATCTANGTKTFTCTLCGDIRTEEVPALGHNWDDGTVTKEPTCTAEGSKQFQCVRCQTTMEEIIPKTEHTEAVLKGYAPTCGKNGFTDGIVCSVCGSILQAKTPIPATGLHEFSDWVIDKEPTCSETGVKHRQCIHCNAIEQESIAKISEHIDANGDNVCDHCGESIEPVVPDNVCKYCGRIHTGFFAPLVRFFHGIFYFFKQLFS